MARLASLIKHLSRILPIFAAIGILLLSCGDSSITSPPTQPEPLRYQNEAEQMALFLQGTLHPSDWLTKQINDELVLIRDTWGDSIPIVNMPFQTNLKVSSVELRVDTSLYIEIMDGSNPVWNQLSSGLDIEVHDYAFSWFPRLLYTTSTRNLHSVRLAEHFVEFPGIEFVYAVELGNVYFEGFAREEVGNEIRYYYREILCPDLWFSYFYVKIEGDSAIYCGQHRECWSGDFEWLFNEYPGNTYIDFLEEWVDSAETHRPAWVDEARNEISQLNRIENLFYWERP